MFIFWTVLLGIQVGGRKQMICSKWKVEMFAKGLKMVYVSLTHRNINSISLILLLRVFHFGSHPLMKFSLHNHDWQDLFPGDCMSWLWYQGQRVWCFVTCRSPSGQAQCLRHWSSSVMPMHFPDSPLSHFWWLTGTQILQWAGILCGELSFICVPSVSLSPYPL